MTRFLCVGDLHVLDKPPAGATEKYMDDLFSSMHHTVDLAIKHKVDAVVWAGDVFHHKNPARTSHATVLKVIEVVKRYIAAGIPLYIVTGNHDISNDLISSVRQKQPLGVILEAGAIELHGWAPGLPLYGVQWQQDWFEDGIVESVFDEWVHSAPSPALAVTHCSIFPPEEVKNVMYEHIPAERIAAAMGNTGSLYYGHIHEDHGFFEVDGVLFGNVGALSRGSLHEYNMDRKIQAALWEDGQFTALDIPHLPSTDILRVAEHYEAKVEKKDLDAFIESVGTSTLDITSTADIIKHISDMKDVEANVRRRSIALVEEVS